MSELSPMPENNAVRFVPSSVKIPQFSPLMNRRGHLLHRQNHNHLPLFANIQLSAQTLFSNLAKTKNSVNQFVSSITNNNRRIGEFVNSLKIDERWLNLHKGRKFINPFRSKTPLLCSASLAVTRGDEEGESAHPKGAGHSGSRHDEERVLISEVLVRNKDGEELERKDLEIEAIAALKTCRPNSALTVQEVQEDVHRIIGSGYFSSCMPVAIDTRDGIRLVFQVEPNQEFQGLVCEGANVLPSKFVEDAFRDGYGKVVNIRRLDEVISSINGWYMERGLFGLVSGIEILSGGIIRLQVSEAEVNNISVRFLKRTGEPTVGKTRPETILRQLNTKKGQVYSMLQGKRDVDTLLAMGIMEDVSIVPQPAGDTGKVDLTINAVERVSGGISAGGGISSGITSGPLAGLIGSCALYHRNLFGRNQKINLSLERGQIDSIFRINYTDPWIDGDDKRTSRTIMIQNSRAPGTLVHGNQPNNTNLTIGKITASIEYGRPFRPKWSGTAGLIFQRAGVHDDKGNPMIRDFYSSPLTASGNVHDEMVLAKLESVDTGSGGPDSSMFVVNMEQGLPVWTEWQFSNRVTAHARKGLVIGPAFLTLSLSGGHCQAYSVPSP